MVLLTGLDLWKRKQRKKTVKFDFWNAAYYESLKLLSTKMAEEPVKKNLDVSYQPEIPSNPEN